MQAALLPEAPEEPAPPAKRPSAALKILGIGWPVMLTTLAGQARSLLTYWLLNHMSHGDSTEMAAFSLADIWCRVTGICFISGLGGGLDTFASQAYGAKQHKKLGLQVLRTFILLTLFINIPIITVWLFAEPILIASGQDPIVASKVRMYARIAIPGQLCLCLTICLVKMLQAMGKTKKMASINLSFTAIGLVATYAAVDKPGHLGVLGAAVVNTSIQVCTAFVYILVVARDPECRQCWPGINSSALRGWCAYLKIAVPCFVMGVCEWWSWDIVTFLAGECNTVTGHPKIFGGNATDAPSEILAAQGLMQEILGTSYFLAVGVGAGTGTVVGNALGEGDAAGAARAARVGHLMGTIAIGLGSASLVLLRDYWQYVFPADADLIRIIRLMIIWVAAFGFMDGSQVILGEVLIGAGKQAVTVPLLVVAYWILGLPLGSVAAFAPPFHVGLLGIWWGMTLGVSLHLAFYLLLVFCPCMPGAIRWDEAAKAAAERIDELGNEEGATPADEASTIAPLDPARGAINAERQEPSGGRA